MATPTFVAATQKWVMNRIQEVKNYVQDVKGSIIEVITNLANIHDRDMKTVSTKFNDLADEIVTGKIIVDGDATVGNSLTVNAGIQANGMASSAPIVCSDPAGLLLTIPGRKPTGLNSTTLTLVNERGKIGRFFMRGDKLYYDYEYDKIYTYFEEATGAKLQYLKRGSTPLMQIVHDVENVSTTLDDMRIEELEKRFFDPDEKSYPTARLFNCTVRQLFPSVGSRFMIPESLLFTVPAMWKVRSIKLVNNEGSTIKVLHDFSGCSRPVHKLLVNFPFIRRCNEELATAGSPREGDDPTATSITELYDDAAPVGIEHIGDFHNGYYEVTDPGAMHRFHASDEHGLLPNVIFHLNEFPKDQVSVIYFDVVHA